MKIRGWVDRLLNPLCVMYMRLIRTTAKLGQEMKMLLERQMEEENVIKMLSACDVMQ